MAIDCSTLTHFTMGPAALHHDTRRTWLSAATTISFADRAWQLTGYNEASLVGDSAIFLRLPSKVRARRLREATTQLLVPLQASLIAGAERVLAFLATAQREGLLMRAQELAPRLAAGVHLDELPVILDATLARLRTDLNRNSMGESIRQAVRLADYPDTFLAHSRARKLIAVLGPTNSGKTYDAFERLSRAQSGVYLGPLRLLALEAFNRLNDEFGVPTDLRTGEDCREVDGSRVTASTIEMLNPDRAVEVAVIDEIQMLLDPDRGWAWTQAVVGVNAAEVWLLGALSAEPAIRAIADRLGLPLEIRYKERKHPLSVAPTALAPAPLASLELAQKGDAWVVFSRRNALALRDDFLARGRKVACIYGMLSPEVREREAARFASGDAEILVATDAIGMGLNLPIQRVVFTAVQKFDGEQMRQLDIPLLQQIGGRAGRYGHQTAEDGVVVGLTSAEHDVVMALMTARQPKLADRGFLIAPSQAYLERLAQLAGTQRLEALLAAYVQHADQGDGFFVAHVPTEMMDRAAQLDAMRNLSLADKHILAMAPLSTQHELLSTTWTNWMRQTNRGEPVGLDFLTEPPDQASLETAEMAVQQLWAYLWLAYRLPQIFTSDEHAQALLPTWVDVVDHHLRSLRKQGVGQAGKAAWYRQAPSGR